MEINHEPRDLIDINKDGYIVHKDTGNIITDGYGTAIKKENIATNKNNIMFIINLPENDLEINNNGFIVHNGKKISKFGKKESFVPINNSIALVRDNKKALSKYAVISRD